MTNNDNVIDIISSNECKVIKGIENGANEIDIIGIIDIYRTKVFKSTKSKDLVYLIESRVGFLIPKTRLAFIKSK